VAGEASTAEVGSTREIVERAAAVG
jgi:hypothetical protein